MSSFGARVILPRQLVVADPDKIIRAVENALDGAALAAKADFGVTTQTWSERSKPTFEISRGELLRKVFTTGKIYGFVNDGTPPHTIKAKKIDPATGKIKPLAFKVPYQAKTAPRVIASGPGGGGASWVAAQEVQHPGFEGRHFDEVIADKWREQLPKTLQRAIDSEVS